MRVKVLRSYAGDYTTEALPVSVAVGPDGRLTMTPKGQPAMALRPVSDTEFRIDGTPMRVVFDPDRGKDVDPVDEGPCTGSPQLDAGEWLLAGDNGLEQLDDGDLFVVVRQRKEKLARLARPAHAASRTANACAQKFPVAVPVLHQVREPEQLSRLRDRLRDRRGLPARWEREDEFYNFKSINPSIHVLVDIDDHVTGLRVDENHPLVPGLAVSVEVPGGGATSGD